MAAKKQVVRYIGIADRREISVNDWRRAGIETDEPRAVVWDGRNQLTIDKEDLDFLTEDEFNRFIRNDGKFVVLDVNAS